MLAPTVPLGCFPGWEGQLCLVPALHMVCAHYVGGVCVASSLGDGDSLTFP